MANHKIEINSLSEDNSDESLQFVTVLDRPELSAIDASPTDMSTDGNQSTKKTNSTCPVRNSTLYTEGKKEMGRHSFGPPEDVVNCENN